MICTNCYSTISGSAPRTCPVCGVSFSQRYDDPIELIRNISDRIKQRDVTLTPKRVNELFSMVMGAIQQALNTACDDMTKTLRKRNRPASTQTDEDGTTLRLIAQFSSIQQVLQENGTAFLNVVRGCQDIAQLEQHLPILEALATRIEATLSQLGSLSLQIEYPELALPERPNPPVDVRPALAALSECNQGLVSFISTRNPYALQESVEQAELLCKRLRQAIETARSS